MPSLVNQSKACCWPGRWFILNGLATLANFGPERPKTFPKPKIDRISVTLVGGSSPYMVSIVLVKTSRFCWANDLTELIHAICKILHFFRLRVTSASYNNTKTCRTASICSSGVGEKWIHRLNKQGQNFPLTLNGRTFIARWRFPGTFSIPNVTGV